MKIKHILTGNPFQNNAGDIAKAALLGLDCVGYEKIVVDDDPVKSLTVPSTALYAVLVVEADATTADMSRVLRFREDGNNPTATDGMPVSHLEAWDVRDVINMAAFRMIGIEPGKVHTVHVQYYG